MKTCTKCNVEKSESEFYFSKTVGRYIARCKRCFIDGRKEYRKEYKKSHPEMVAAEKRRHYQKHKEEIRKKKRPLDAVYASKRRKVDATYRIKNNLRRLIRQSFQRGGYTKKSRTHAIIGCDFDVFKAHIESQFTDGMSWDLVGRHIHIDHIVPLASASTEEDIYRLNHYTNLCPLWASDNLAKGSKLVT